MTISTEQKEAFLADLTVISRKHGIAIDGCGCCDSPRLEEIVGDGSESMYRTDDYEDVDGEFGWVSKDVPRLQEPFDQGAWLESERLKIIALQALYQAAGAPEFSIVEEMRRVMITPASQLPQDEASFQTAFKNSGRGAMGGKVYDIPPDEIEALKAFFERRSYSDGVAR